MANEKLSGFLGLARKAGKLVFGFDMTVESIQKGTAKAVLLSSDCSERTARNIKRIAEENKTEILRKEKELGEYLKRELKKLDFVKIYFNEKNVNGVFSFNLGKIPSSVIADILNENYEICVRSGLHCAPLVHHVNGSGEQGMVRVSISSDNTKEDIDSLVLALKEISKKIN